MASGSDDDPYNTWPPHPDPEVEEIFLGANRASYVIHFLEGTYTLVSPDATEDFQFLGRVVASSGVWRHMVSELRDWLEQTANEAEGRGDSGLQDLAQGDCRRRLGREDGGERRSDS